MMAAGTSTSSRMPSRLFNGYAPARRDHATSARAARHRLATPRRSEHMRGDGLALALERQRHGPCVPVALAYAFEDLVGHDDLAGAGAGLQARRRVDDVTDRREVLDRAVADVADARDPVVQAHPDRQGIEPGEQLTRAADHDPARLRTAGEGREARQEEAHDLVADELVDDRVALDHHRGRDRVEAV